MRREPPQRVNVFGPTKGLTVSQAAQVGGVGESAVRMWIKRRHLHRNVHGLIDAEELMIYLDTRGTVGQHKRARQIGLKVVRRGKSY